MEDAGPDKSQAHLIPVARNNNNNKKTKRKKETCNLSSSFFYSSPPPLYMIVVFPFLSSQQMKTKKVRIKRDDESLIALRYLSPSPSTFPKNALVHFRCGSSDIRSIPFAFLTSQRLYYHQVDTHTHRETQSSMPLCVTDPWRVWVGVHVCVYV